MARACTPRRFPACARTGVGGRVLGGVKSGGHSATEQPYPVIDCVAASRRCLIPWRRLCA